MSRDLSWECRGIYNPKTIHTMDLEIGIDDTIFIIHAGPRSSYRMVEGLCMAPDPVFQFLICDAVGRRISGPPEGALVIRMLRKDEERLKSLAAPDAECKPGTHAEN